MSSSNEISQRGLVRRDLVRHGIADAIGIPYTTAARGSDAPEVREQAGVNQFYRVRYVHGE